MTRLVVSIACLAVMGLLAHAIPVYTQVVVEQEQQVLDETIKPSPPIPGSKSTLRRHEDRLEATFESPQLPSGTYTFWIAVFNNPIECATSPCSGADLKGSPSGLRKA